MIIVGAAPVTGPPVTPPPITFPPEQPTAAIGTGALRVTFTAPWLSRTWDLTDLATPSPVLKYEGMTGLGQADPVHWFRDAPAVDGARWTGGRVGAGRILLPVIVQGPDPGGFIATNQAFTQALDPRRECVLRVYRPDATWRQIACRYESGGDLTADYDPVSQLMATYALSFVTGDPYWSGEEVEQTFNYVAAASFFPGPPFTILPTNLLGSATAANPGDVDAAPVWRVNGPFTGFTVGVGTATVSMTLAKNAGQWVDIDMSPDALTIRDEAGVDRWTSVTAVSFAAIPPGSAALVTTVSGAGLGTSVRLRFTPRYRRAW